MRKHPAKKMYKGPRCISANIKTVGISGGVIATSPALSPEKIHHCGLSWMAGLVSNLCCTWSHAEKFQHISLSVHNQTF
jgi:hypothetical protein